MEDEEARTADTRSRFNREFRDYMRSWSGNRGRARFLPDEAWKMSQSNDTKTWNLGKDFDEMSHASQTIGGRSVTQDARFWMEQEEGAHLR